MSTYKLKNVTSKQGEINNNINKNTEYYGYNKKLELAGGDVVQSTRKSISLDTLPL